MKIKRNSRSIYYCCAALLALAIASPVSARLLVTDFSEGAIDAMAIGAAEGERRIDNGALLMSARGKGAATGYTRTSQWATDETWSTTAGMTQASVTVDSIDLGTSGNKIAFAQLAGFFYNTRVAPGDAEGDVFVQLIVGDRGNGLEVWYEIETSLNAAFTDSSTSNGVVIAPGSLNLGTAVILNLEYDGARTFTFTVDNGTPVTADGPPRLDTPYYTGRGLRTGIDSLVPTDDMVDDGSAAQIVAHFDNVIVDNLAYDDFTAVDIDRSNWFRGKLLRSITAGALRIEVETPDTTSENNRINLRDVESNLVEAALELSSASILPSGTRGRVRIHGYWYNDTFNAPPYTGYLGNIWAQLSIRQNADGSLQAFAAAERSDDAIHNLITDLFFQNFTATINLDQVYRASIELVGGILRFTLDNETIDYPIVTDIFPVSPAENNKQIVARIQDGPGKVVAFVHDIYTDNEAPTIDPGSAQSVTGADSVTLSATATDADGVADLFWEQTAGTAVIPVAGQRDQFSFTAPTLTTAETLTFQATAVDKFGATSTGEVMVSVSASSNSAPTAFALVSPDDGATGLGTSLTFVWKKATDPDGDSISYQFSLCEDSGFVGCTPTVVASAEKVIDYAGAEGLLPLVLFGTVLGGIGLRRRKWLMMAIVSLAIIGLVSNCGGSSTPDPTDEISHTESGLKTATTYFWKVSASDGTDTVESATRSFTTQ